MQWNRLFCARVLLAAATAAAQQRPVHPADRHRDNDGYDVAAMYRRHFNKINEDFLSGGQPRPEHFAALKSQGVRAVINLRTPGEHRAAEEETRVKELGMRYINIAVVFTDPKDEQVAEFLRVTDDKANRPAFIHCNAAIPVGAFWMIRRVLRDGWTVERAEKEAEEIGLRHSPHLNQFARRYIAAHRKK